jgi:hypothetical protein
MVPIRKEVKHEKHRNCFGILLLAIAAPAITFKNIPAAKQNIYTFGLLAQTGVS